MPFNNPRFSKTIRTSHAPSELILDAKRKFKHASDAQSLLAEAQFRRSYLQDIAAQKRQARELG